MLLITDRKQETTGLQRTLDQAQVCTTLHLHEALQRSFSHSHSLVVCDVALDNMTSIELLNAALMRHRPLSSVSLLCLIRDTSHLTYTLAKSIGATEVLYFPTSADELLSTIRQMASRSRNSDQATAAAERRLQQKLRDAGSSLSDMLRAAKKRQPISTATLERGGDAVLAALEQNTIRAWLDFARLNDDITFQHCLLVAGLAAAFGLELGLTQDHQRLLSQAALVHDLGKAHVPSEILNKPGPLTPSEMNVMKRHPTIGHDLLVAQGRIDARILDVVRHHHEYLDGSGYPDNLSASQISRLVRIVTICDIYAAMVERRSYKEPAPPERAFSVLVGMGEKLDVNLVAVFRNFIVH